MELIDEWSDSPLADRMKTRAQVQEIGRRLHGFSPRILSTHCYVDVGHGWLHLVFDDLIAPEVALRAGALLEGLPDVTALYFNSLRPRALFFLVTPPLEKNVLPAERYGVTIHCISKVWQGSPPGSNRRPCRGQEA